MAGGLLASQVAGRLRMPGLLLVLGVGMLAGATVLPFGDYELARTVGVIALALILFEGGLSAGFPEIRPVLGSAVSLAVLGTALTALVTGLTAAALLDLSTLEGLLLGAILSSTDGAAVFALLRGSRLRRRLARTLEAEAGMNDPVAVLLVIGCIEALDDPSFGAADFAGLLAMEIAIGAAIGAGIGFVAVTGFRRLRLPTAGLYPVLSLTVAALAYGLADSLHGSGFLSVYLAGLVLGSAPVPARRTVRAFHEGLAWVAQLVMFLTLGLLVFPNRLDEVALEATLVALVLVFVARPLAAAVAAGPGFGAAERVLLGWAGLRGAVPVVLATFPVTEGVKAGEGLFDLVFFAVFLSTALQGTTVEPLARRLGLTTSEPALPPPLVEVGSINDLGADMVGFEVAPDDAIAGHRIREIGLPREALVSVLVRDGQVLLPRGSTRVRPGDQLHVLFRREVETAARETFERWRTGPVGRPPRPPRPTTAAAPVFVSRPWSDSDGDAAFPRTVAGRAVVDQLRTRADVPGALVVLDDGRYAVTGPVLLMGARQQVQEQARRRLRAASSEEEQAWWQEVIGECAL